MQNVHNVGSFADACRSFFFLPLVRWKDTVHSTTCFGWSKSSLDDLCEPKTFGLHVNSGRFLLF